MFIQTIVDVETLDEPFSRKELNNIKKELSDLRIHVEALLKKPNQQVSPPISSKGNNGSKGKQSLAPKIIRINLIILSFA